MLPPAVNERKPFVHINRLDLNGLSGRRFGRWHEDLEAIDQQVSIGWRSSLVERGRAASSAGTENGRLAIWRLQIVRSKRSNANRRRCGQAVTSGANEGSNQRGI
jgi:hypothetical protein